MTKSQISRFFNTLAARDPAPQTELLYTNPYTLLVAVVLSAQATDKGVNKATETLFKIVQTPQDMLHLGEDGLKSYIKSIGLYQTKAKNVIALSQQLIDRHQGTVPEDRTALEALPGVGRKTANVVLSVVFGHHTIAVDTHVFRVSNRTGLAPGASVTAVEARLEKRVPLEYKRHAHHWLILLGRYICKARTPLCAECPVRAVCGYSDKSP